MSRTFNQLADELSRELDALFRRFPDLHPDYTPEWNLRIIVDASPALKAFRELEIALGRFKI